MNLVAKNSNVCTDVRVVCLRIGHQTTIQSWRHDFPHFACLLTYDVSGGLTHPGQRASAHCA